MTVVYRPTYQDHATGETRTSNFYYARHGGKRWPLKVTDRRVAEEKARQLVAQLELGYDPQQIEKAKREGVLALVAEYLDHLTPNTGKTHRDKVGLRLRKVVAGVGAVTLPQLSADAVAKWLASSGLAARTRHHYTVNCRSFGRWLVKAGKANRNPFEALEGPRDIENDRRRVRRALTQEELSTLIERVPESRYTRCGVPPADRAVLYRLASVTGLRRNELASLRPSSFVLAALDGGVSFVVVRATSTKNRKEARQPLPSALVPVLRQWLAGRSESVPLFPITNKKTGLAIIADMKEVGLDVTEVGGQLIDFHSLRVTFGTGLALAGVPLALAQKLLRHSTPVLTASVYTMAAISDLSKEVEKLG